MWLDKPTTGALPTIIDLKKADNVSSVDFISGRDVEVGI
jgi:hypothetical protein